MGHLYKFNLLQMIRSKEDMFWPLIFPILLGTLFFVTFGSSDTESMNPVPAAVVKEGNGIFETFLQAMDGETLVLSEMGEEEAQEALKNGEIEGIFYSGKEPSLTVAGVQINESILEMLLDMYLQNQRMLEEIGEESMLRLVIAAGTLLDYQDFLEQADVSGKALDNNVDYFFALIGMACLFGAFMGMTAAMNLRADQSALASRRCTSPVGRLTMVISEMLAAFTVQIANIGILLLYLHFVLHISFGSKWPLILPVCVLGSMAGVALGIFIGSLRFREGVKTALLVGSSLSLSFLAGLMMGGMKDIVERHCPALNRINPAALISDAFYSISVYENPARYRMDLALLAAVTVVLVGISFLKLRRERYDSI